MKKVEELKDLGCSVRGRFYDLAWSKPVLRAPAVHGVSSNSVLVYFCVFHRALLGGVLSNWCSCALRT